MEEEEDEDEDEDKDAVCCREEVPHSSKKYKCVAHTPHQSGVVPSRKGDEGEDESREADGHREEEKEEEEEDGGRKEGGEERVSRS